MERSPRNALFCTLEARDDGVLLSEGIERVTRQQLLALTEHTLTLTPNSLQRPGGGGERWRCVEPARQQGLGDSLELCIEDVLLL